MLQLQCDAAAATSSDVAAAATSSDVLAWPGSKPGQATNRPSQSQAMSLAYLGLWPWLEIFKARGLGLSHGFGLNFLGEFEQNFGDKFPLKAIKFYLLHLVFN